MLEHPDVSALSFVGSTPITRYIYETGTRHGKRVQALGGAKNHMIVLPDVDIEMAGDAAVSAAYGSAGERCMAVSVVVAVGDAAEPRVAAIKERLPKITVGDGIHPASEMGPLVTREHHGVARQFQFDVEAGMVRINVPIPVTVAYYSFGCWNASLFGDSHIYGPEGIHFYTRGRSSPAAGPTRPRARSTWDSRRHGRRLRDHVPSQRLAGGALLVARK